MVMRVAISMLLLSPCVAFMATPPKHVRTDSTKVWASDSFTVGILGDLHLDPRKMEDYEEGREQWVKILEEAKKENEPDNVALVSLGDLGESKNCDHNDENPSELFAGTTVCHELAAEFLTGFGVPYEVVGGNHDLEGLDEFDTDEANLELFLRAHNKPTPNFIRTIADKTLMVGLTSTVFRDAKYTSHEVTVDQEQIDWFEQVLIDHPAEDGWKIFVATHAPPLGSGLRTLQENHVVNGCCWLNHSDEEQCLKYINLVRKHRCVKAWFSGHFHLGQDYQDSITFPTIDPKEGPYPNRGSCVFVQTSVIRGGTSRDGRRQSRLLRGNKDGFDICTVDHMKEGAIRVDATVTYKDVNHEVGVYRHEDILEKGEKFFKVYSPSAGDEMHPPDENLVNYNEAGELHITEPITMDTKAWWYMSSGRVLGTLNGMLIEYEPSALAPLGLVVGADELIGKRISVIDSGIDAEECEISYEEGMEGADCAAVTDSREQALLLLGPDSDSGPDVVVVQPNEDGTYWRKIVRNKVRRMQEKRREKAAMAFASMRVPELVTSNGEAEEKEPKIISSWGPYVSTVGTAKTTGVEGLTK